MQLYLQWVIDTEYRACQFISMTIPLFGLSHHGAVQSRELTCPLTGKVKNTCQNLAYSGESHIIPRGISIISSCHQSSTQNDTLQLLMYHIHPYHTAHLGKW